MSESKNPYPEKGKIDKSWLMVERIVIFANLCKMHKNSLTSPIQVNSATRV